ncbi:hypothetical protein ACRT6R_001701 [Campylobacter coli]
MSQKYDILFFFCDILFFRRQQEILNKFSGWGGIPQAFDHQNKEWEKEFKELISTLDYAEYEKAKTSTLDAFYTPKIIIDTIYQGLITAK